MKKNQTALNIELHSACRKGDLDSIDYLLTSPELEIHADIEHISESGFQWACFNGYLDIVQYLLTSSKLKKHIDIASDDYGGLSSACLGRRLNVVKYLLETFDLNENTIGDDYHIAFVNVLASDNLNTDIIDYFIIDRHIERTEYVNEQLIKKPNPYVEKLFSMRDLNKNLNKELDDRATSVKKIKL